MSISTATSGPTDRRAATLVMACLGVFIAYLPITTVAASLPAIQAALSSSTAQLSWVQDAFVLPMAALILTAGVFGDVHGRKKVFQAGLAFCAIGAAVALCAQSVQVLWIGQAVSGLGAAALLPTTLALISHAVPDFRERGKFIGLWATSLMASLAVGSLIAGVILDHAAWRWIYLLPIPVSLIALALSAPLLSDSRAPHGRRLDWPGQITAALAITAAVYGVIEGGAGSFTNAKVLVALATSAISAVAFVLAERRSDSPMLDLRLFRSPAFTATTLVAMITFLGLIGFFFVLSLYFGMVQQLDTLQAGFRLLMVTLAALVVGAPVGRLMHRVSARVLITGGLLVVAASLLSLTALDATTPFASVAWRLALLGLGMGTVMTPMTATAVASVPYQLAGMAAAGNNAFRQVGGALGPAVLGALLTTRALHTLPEHLADAGLTGATQQRIVSAADADGLGAVAQLNLGADTSRALDALGSAFLDGLHLCLIVAAVLTLIAALCSVILLRRPRETKSTVVRPKASAAATSAKDANGADHGRSVSPAETVTASDGA
ncbi:MFS transporter [Streptomyces sp. NBC_01262]|uniref:MFS transporter n=1 Tax=Streptomyces sp. NBC_01262 TaxID=2903803 RepID=UPI002E36842E|nr:MFS transporter [Streptomyces sp. NBC_01262]